MNFIVVPLTDDTRSQHAYFFESALVDVIIDGDSIKRIDHGKKHKYIQQLRLKKEFGLVLFSTGITGRPKAILHNSALLRKWSTTKRPSLTTLNFLLFDHIGGLNTLFLTLFSKGTSVAIKSRNVEDILSICSKYRIEVLPTTPTFLRMLLMSGLVPDKVSDSLQTITYGTEPMDQTTLDMLCSLLPKIDFRQAYGMSEIGIVPSKNKSRNSLFIKLGSDEVKVKTRGNELAILSQTRMCGYLNTESPFDADGWYYTGDLVEEMDGFYRIVGRTNEVINVGGLKFMPSEVERIALQFQGVAFAKAKGENNPITGQHVELTVEPIKGTILDKLEMQAFLSKILPKHMCPQKLVVSDIAVSHRFKKSTT